LFVFLGGLYSSIGLSESGKYLSGCVKKYAEFIILFVSALETK